MSGLTIENLSVNVAGKEILSGVNLSVKAGEVHAVMGPNGAGKSTLSNAVMGRAGYEVTGGRVTLDGVDLLTMDTYQRAQAGLFYAMQAPTEVPGVSMHDMITAALQSAGSSASALGDTLVREASAIGFDAALLERSLNVDLSGGEKKRSETLQMSVLGPKIALVDELDSGLDVDGLRTVARRVEQLTNDGLGVLLITHFPRVLHELQADRVHVLAQGRIVKTGGPELAFELEQTGYGNYVEESPKQSSAGGFDDLFNM
ncbi:MAG: Fe-S cluster assembly ATPase SufC [Acidimicrobiales bacterium]|nr:Fe-S cluster assembly ATPase SufC [Acidimicrobiales bacterium]